MHLAVDEHERQVYIVARERLFDDRAFGLGEQGVDLAFEVFELVRGRRFVLRQQGADALGELFERSPDIARCGFVDRRMGYFHWGSPPQCFDFAISIVAEDHCPVLLPQPARRDKLSPVSLYSYISVFHKSLEFDHLYVVLDVSSRSSATRQGWSRRIGVCDDPMKPCSVIQRVRNPSGKGEPARPVASLAPGTVTDSAKRRHASEWAVGHAAPKGICSRVPKVLDLLKATATTPRLGEG